MRALSLDLSSSKTGWVIGSLGKLPEKAGNFFRPKDMKMHPDLFKYFAEEIVKLTMLEKIGCVICEEVNVSQNMHTTRTLCGLYGAVSFALKDKLNIDLFSLNTTTCRSKAGVDLRRKNADGSAMLTPVKVRAMERLSELGFDTSDEDIADAAIVLIGAGQIIENQTEDEPKEKEVKLSW